MSKKTKNTNAQNNEDISENEDLSSDNLDGDNVSEELEIPEKEDFVTEIENLKNQVLYAKAESENIRRRGLEDTEKTRRYAIESFSQELLSVKDSLEASLNIDKVELNALKDGVDLTLKQLNSVFDKFNIVEINPTGEIFDPNFHQAMTMLESKEHDDNTIITVLQKGYTLNDRVIRPAMVTVAKNKN